MDMGGHEDTPLPFSNFQIAPFSNSFSLLPFSGSCSPSDMRFVLFHSFRPRTVLGAVLLPWVARPNRHLNFDKDFVPGRLPRAIHVQPFQGFNRDWILK